MLATILSASVGLGYAVQTRMQPVRPFDLSNSPASVHVAPPAAASSYVDLGASKAMTDVVYKLPAVGLQLNAYDRVLGDLKLYKGLQDGWDGHGSRAPRQAAVMNAIAMLNMLPMGIPTPKATISSAGNISLYWDDDRVYADIAFDGDNSPSLFVTRKDNSMPDVFIESVSLSDVNGEWLKGALNYLVDATA